MKKWEKPIIKHGKMSEYNYIVKYPENLKLGKNFDIGEFTYINSEFSVEIQDNVQIGSHCSIYSNSTIDQKTGPVKLEKNCKIGYLPQDLDFENGRSVLEEAYLAFHEIKKIPNLKNVMDLVG